jgi:acyl-CoA thioester hydrolase
MSHPPDEDRSPARRGEFRHFLPIPTRWMDNDVYGHVNNVVYYSYFDTAVNEHLIRVGGLDIRTSPVIGVVVETRCRFHAELSFPETIEAGLRVRKLGRTSVVYDIGLFREGEDTAAATGYFVHVYVDRTTRTPTEIPAAIREALGPLAAGGTD